jgi:hypothetical protein
MILDKVISRSQNVFISGKQISNLGLLDNKCFNSCFEDKELTMAELSNRFLKLLFLWAGVLNISQVSNMQQFVEVSSSF